MGRHVVVVLLGLAGLAGFALLLGWAFYQVSVEAGGGRSLGPIWPYVIGGVVALGGLIGFFMWLAAYTARHGHDDVDPRPDQPRSRGAAPNERRKLR